VAADRAGQGGFSERIRRRRQLWWRSREVRQTPLDHLRRLAMLHIPLGPGDFDARLYRGLHWQRRLLNKLNSRAFALHHGCQVPELYWCGRHLTRAVLEALPGHFVLKPAVGASRHGVYVMAGDLELLRGETLPREGLFRRVVSERGRWSYNPLLAEEFVPGEERERTLAVDYKIHVFGDTIAAIQRIERYSGPDQPARHRFYTADWALFDDPMNTINPLAAPAAPPACLTQMVDAALRLGGAFGTYIRVDLYATPRGCVFGEFSSLPHAGTHFTPYADELFEDLWCRKFPDAV